MLESYWHAMPNIPTEDIPGKLIVLEGTDGVGRSTQIAMVKRWLESSGLAVHDTGLTRSNLAGRHLQKAKQGHTMGRLTQTLYYASDFADRLENEMIPALRAGYVVLTDRYIYSMMARAIVRGADPQWIRRVYGFAVIPDLVLYLRANLQTLIPRVLARGGFDYWESGVDYLPEDTRYQCFVKHQEALLGAFERMAEEYHFVVVDAGRPVRDVFEELSAHVGNVAADMIPAAGEMAAIPDEGFRPPPADDNGPARSASDILGDLLDALHDE